MGTTLSAAWFLENKMAWVHVGDSRLYLFRDDSLQQITRDHTRNEFATRDGRTTSPEGWHLCQSFIYGSRGLGDNSMVRLEAGLDAGCIDLRNDDVVLICSDGLTGEVGDRQMERLLKQNRDCSAAAQALVDQAIKRGSTDNITAMVIHVDGVRRGASGPEETSEDLEERTVMF